MPERPLLEVALWGMMHLLCVKFRVEKRYTPLKHSHLWYSCVVCVGWSSIFQVRNSGLFDTTLTNELLKTGMVEAFLQVNLKITSGKKGQTAI